MSRSQITITKNEFAIEGGEETVRKLITQTGIQVHAQAVTLCPVDKGQLRNSLMWKTSWSDGGFNSQGGDSATTDSRLDVQPKKDEGYVGTNSDHWYPEFGTRHQVAQPFLRPAAEIVQGSKAADIAKKYGKEAMKEEFAQRKVKRMK